MANTSPNPEYSEAIAVVVCNFNKKLKAHLPEYHNLAVLHMDSSLYYQKLNSTYLRSQSRVLLKHAESWPVEKVMDFFYYCMKEVPDRTFQMTAMFFMMYRYHEIAEDLRNLETFKNWVITGLFDREALTDFAEYCLMPFLNYKRNWIMGILEWARHDHVSIRRAAALGVRKCGVDKDKAHIAVEICSILLEKCKETEIKAAIGGILRQVGKKQKGVLRVFLEENLKILPRKTLTDGVARLSKKEQEFYLAEHGRIHKKAPEHESLVFMDMLEKSFSKKSIGN